MIDGKRFVKEHPDIGTILERLYKIRALDDWYLKKCYGKLPFEEELLEEELRNIKTVKSVKVSHFVEPCTRFYFQLEDINDSDDFCFNQEILLTMSKIAPVYTLDFFYSLRHHAFARNGIFNFSGYEPETTGMKLITTDVTELLNSKGYIQLSQSHDYYDTVYEWHELPDLEPFGRRLTVGEALFYDRLGLCPE